MKLLFNILIVNDSDPGNPDYIAPKVQFNYVGGGTGTKQIRIYEHGTTPPAYSALTSTHEIAATAGLQYDIDYKDSAAEKKVAVVNVSEWAGSCFEDSDTLNWIQVYRLSSKLQATWYGSEVISISIDGGSTYKNLVSGSAEWSNSELTLLGFTDEVPNIKTRRSTQAVLKNADGFSASSVPGFDTPAYTVVSLLTDGVGGLAVSQVIQLSGPLYVGPATIVNIPGPDSIVIQYPFYGDQAGVQILDEPVACISDILEAFFVGEISFEPMVVSESHTNVTVTGGSDGGILISVAGGSGSFTYAWGDGPTTQNRSGLSPGTYEVTVTDTVTGLEASLSITITEPVAVVTEGTFLRVPLMNSLHFVDRSKALDPFTNPQALDNRLLCEQSYPGYDQTNYFQKVCQADSRITQFESDFSNFRIRLFDYYTQEIIKTFAFSLKEQNIGVASDYGITIRNNPAIPGTSRVYFNVAALPIPIATGDGFTIMNSLDGFNGNYAIIDIENDLTLGYQYLVINKTYTPIATSVVADGRFYTNVVDFNVFETFKEFNDVPEGDYFVQIQALDLSGQPTIHIWESEPIALRELHPNTNLVEYKNIDNAFDMTWSTGYIGQVRVESTFGHNRPTGGERSVSRDADFSLTKINAKKQRVLLFSTMELPPYLHEKLSVAFDCDYFAINKLECQANEAYGEAAYADRYLLGSSSIKVEQKHWFRKYNSNDIGTVNEFPNPITVDNTEVTVDNDEITIDQVTF